MIKGNANQKKFIRNMARAMNSPSGKVDASAEYAKVYEVKDNRVAEANASRLLAKPEVQKTLSEYLAIDYPKSKRSKRLTELANSEKDHVLQDGTIIPIRDNQSSLRALELMAKLDGETNDGGVTNIDARSVNIQLDAKDVERLADVVNKMQALRQNSLAKE